MRYMLLIYASETDYSQMTSEERAAIVQGHGTFAQEAVQRGCTGCLVHRMKKVLWEAIDQGEKESEHRAGKRVSFGREMLCWSALALQNLSTRFSRVKERVRKAESKESAPRSRGKACCYLSSGTEEEMRGSSGRIRDQRMRPALEGLKATGRNRRDSNPRSSAWQADMLGHYTTAPLHLVGCA